MKLNIILLLLIIAAAAGFYACRNKNMPHTDMSDRTLVSVLYTKLLPLEVENGYIY